MVNDVPELQRLAPMDPEGLPVRQNELTLREAVRPKNRELSHGGILMTVGSVLVMAAGEIAAHSVEIVSLVNSLGVDSDIVLAVTKGAVFITAVYAMVTREKK